jgi:signal transduction histidine kinase
MLIVDGEGNIRASNAAARAALDLGEKGRVWEITWLDRRVSLDGGSIVPLLKGSAAVLGRRLYDPEGNESDVVLDILDLSGKKSGGGPKLVHIKDYSPYTNYERWKDELLSMAAHEIKNPLAAMKSSMNVLMSNAADAMTKGQRDLLGVSLRSIDRLTRLLDNVLDVSSIAGSARASSPPK